MHFAGPPAVGMTAVVWCRTAHRVMELLAASRWEDGDIGIRDREGLHRFVRRAIHAPSVLGDGRGGLLTLSVGTVYAGGRPPRDLCHSHYTALTVKNALVDAVRDAREGGDRPNVDVDDPDVPLVAVVRGRPARGVRDRRRGGRQRRDDDGGAGEEDEDLVADVDLYRCLHAGGSLHRRGYRQADDGTAPIHKVGIVNRASHPS